MLLKKEIKNHYNGHDEIKSYDGHGRLISHTDFFGTKQYEYDVKDRLLKIQLSTTSYEDPNIYEWYITNFEYSDNRVREMTYKINSLDVDQLNYNQFAKVPTKGTVYDEIINIREKKTNSYGIVSDKFTDIVSNVSTVKEYKYNINGQVINEQEYRYEKNAKYLALEIKYEYGLNNNIKKIEKYGQFGSAFVLYEKREVLEEMDGVYRDIFQEAVDYKFIDESLKIGYIDLSNLKENKIINKFSEEIPDKIELSVQKKTIKDFDRHGNVVSFKVVDSLNEAKYYKRQFYFNDYDCKLPRK